MGVFRLLLALSVLSAHTHGRSILGFRFLGGDLAVQCFYIISGFYMALVLHEKYTEPGSYGTFIVQRFLRLYPTYWFIALFVLLVEGLVYWQQGTSVAHVTPWVAHLTPWYSSSSTLSPFTAATLATGNVVVIGVDYFCYLGIDPDGHLYFTPNYRQAPVVGMSYLLCPPAWTLGVEVSFYLLAPFLVRRSVAVQGSLLAASLGARWLMAWAFHFPYEPWIYRFFPIQLCFFLAGSLAYRIYRDHHEKLHAITASRPWMIWVFWVFVAFYSRLPFTHQLYVVFLPAMVLAVPLLFAATKSNRIDRLIGELSYPVYLSHPLMIFCVNRLAGDQLPRTFYGPLYLLMTLTFSYLFYRFIESRTEQFRAWLFDRTRGKQGNRRDHVELDASAYCSVETSLKSRD